MPAKNNNTWKGKSLWPEIKSILDERKPLIVYDLETTGLSSSSERIIEIAAIKYDVDEKYQMHEVETYHQYLNPGRELSDVIVELTGITNEMLADKPYEEELFVGIRAFFSDCAVAGYNIVNFDNKFMAELFGRMGEFFTTCGSIDCLKMAKNRLKRDEEVENFKLSTVGKYFGLEFTAHSAIEDARTTGKLVQIFINEYLADSAKPVETPKGLIQPHINTISFWAGFKGFSRIYVNCEEGTIYYDVRNQLWGGKDIDIATIDMDFVEKEVFRLTNSINETEFSRFKGSIVA